MQQTQKMPDFWVFRPISLAIIPFLVYSITMINTKNVKKDLLRFKHDDMDGQDYETAANLIGGNQFIAAANFIDRLDTMPREHMITLIYKNKKLWNEMWYFDHNGYFCTRETVCASFKPIEVKDPALRLDPNKKAYIQKVYQREIA